MIWLKRCQTSITESVSMKATLFKLLKSLSLDIKTIIKRANGSFFGVHIKKKRLFWNL